MTMRLKALLFVNYALVALSVFACASYGAALIFGGM
jgi:hypothetical protein